MAFRCEINGRLGWIVYDEHRDLVGERKLSRRQYDAAMHRQLGTREFRVTEFDAPRIHSMPIQIPELAALGRTLAKK